MACQACLLWRTSNDPLSHVLRWWGFRAESLGIYVNFTSGKVSYFSYHLMVSAPGVPPPLPPPPPDGKLGLVVIGLSSQRVIDVERPELDSQIASALLSVLLPGRVVTEHRNWLDSRCPRRNRAGCLRFAA